VIIGMILQQSLLMGILAYAIGYFVILLTYEKFPRRIVLEAFDLQMLFVIVMAICMISSFVGIRKALKVEPAEALGG
jgi:putative ABC transport system permease protein